MRYFPPFTPHELDLLVPCGKCGAKALRECVGTGTVHFVDCKGL